MSDVQTVVQFILEAGAMALMFVLCWRCLNLVQLIVKNTPPPPPDTD